MVDLEGGVDALFERGSGERTRDIEGGWEIMGKVSGDCGWSGRKGG